MSARSAEAPSRRIAVTGASGRLGQALLAAAGARDVFGWSRATWDLDRPDDVGALDRDRPDLVLHCAAWTDVDGCARDPGLALHRNGTATGILARACRDRGVQLLAVSTNEVFDGDRTDGLGYVEDDATSPRNAYGASKLAGEDGAREAFDGQAGLWVVRTSWLYGAPGGAFPEKVVAAADRLPAGEPLPVVVDEVGCPTWSVDLAAAMLALVDATPGGTYHLAGTGPASRLEWATQVLGVRRPGRKVMPISRAAFARVSDAPPWAVLDCGRARVIGAAMRPWDTALAYYLGAPELAAPELGAPEVRPSTR